MTKASCMIWKTSVLASTEPNLRSFFAKLNRVYGPAAIWQVATEQPPTGPDVYRAVTRRGLQEAVAAAMNTTTAFAHIWRTSGAASVLIARVEQSVSGMRR